MTVHPEKTAGTKTDAVHPVRSLARNPRLAVFLAVGCAAAAGWIYLAAMVADMLPAMDMSELGPGMALFNSFNLFAGLSPEARAALAIICLPEGTTTFGMPASDIWSVSDAALVFIMWVMMALAMMLPSAAPMIASYAELPQPMGGSARRVGPVVVLALGYLSIWIGYGALATLAQGLLTAARMMSPMMSPATMVLAGTTLIAAGIYQFTPAKLACLLRCQRPIPFFMERRPVSYVEVYRLGIVQGLLCLGCCWALMTVMFAVGIMNVVWIAVLGFLMALEKTVHRLWIPRAIGVFLILWGVFVLALSDAGQTLLTG
ncbi:Predicted metal-binding membrane protein [Stappia sp. ES.058]|nr:Predicted metal-binding membrane protein [Stappia sp. ES.058]